MSDSNAWRKSKPSATTKKDGLLKATSVLALISCVVFFAGYIFLIKAQPTLKGGAVVFLLINIAELCVYPLLFRKNLNYDDSRKNVLKHLIIWILILALQVGCMISRIPYFFMVPGGLLIHNITEITKEGASELNGDYHTYNILFIVAGSLSILMSLTALIGCVLRFPKKVANEK